MKTERHQAHKPIQPQKRLLDTIISSHQFAQIIGCSSNHAVRLMDKFPDELRSWRVGINDSMSHRRLRLSDAIAYMRKRGIPLDAIATYDKWRTVVCSLDVELYKVCSSALGMGSTYITNNPVEFACKCYEVNPAIVIVESRDFAVDCLRTIQVHLNPFLLLGVIVYVHSEDSAIELPEGLADIELRRPFDAGLLYSKLVACMERKGI